MSNQQKLANITITTASSYDVRPDTFLMEIADYHQLLDALKSGNPHSIRPYYYHKDNTGSSTAFWYQGADSVTIFPQNIFSVTFRLNDYEVGEL